MGMYRCNICGNNVYEDSFYGQIILDKQAAYKMGVQSSETITYVVCRYCFDEITRDIEQLSVEKEDE